MDLTTDFKSYQDRVTSCLVEVTRTATQLSNQDLSFHRSANDKFSKSLDSQNAYLLRLTNKLLKAATSETNIKLQSLQDPDQVEDNWRQIVHVVDDLLERTDASLDEYTGVLKRLSPAPAENTPPPAKEVRSYRSATSLSWSIVQKPQTSFQHKVNNFDDSPFKPLLKSKPHAIIPLEQSIGNGDGGYNHPYAYEIEHFQYPDSLSISVPPMPFTHPEKTQAIYVDTEQGVKDMLEELKKAKEIAIDLEHNDKKSYYGLVCLMQVSTRDKDWIVDTLKPWRENLQILNEVFADPNIIKVFHGASMDMIWLQRDLGLYVVGLFDTYHACGALDFPYRSLKYLLARFANFEAQKQYQTADWRVRPLPPELLDYARSDTHYLLYVFDQLRNMLAAGSTPENRLLDQVLQGSKGEALQVYQKPVYDRESGLGPNGWYNMVTARSSKLSKEQLSVFRAVHEWRDRKARELDEGAFTVLPHHVLWTFAETMPTNAHRLYASLRNVQKHVMDNAPQLLAIIKQAIEDAANGPTLQEVIQQNEEKYGVTPRRFRREQHHNDTALDGVGATLKQLTQNGEIEKEKLPEPVENVSLDPLATRGSSSSLWGELRTTADREVVTSPTSAATALGFVLPMLDFPLRSKTNKESPVAQNPTHITAASNPTSSHHGAKQDTPFVLKDLAKPHKRKAEEMDLDSLPDATVPMDTSPTSNTMTSSTAENDLSQSFLETARQAKQQRKAEKKAQKAAAAALEQQNNQSTATDGNVAPFDYANAASLLQKSSPSTQRQGTKAPQAPMNPFAKALNTSTGAKNSKFSKELTGKGHTFKG